MMALIKEKNGGALIWSLFILLMLFTLSIIIYTSATVYAKFQTCETELERAATITADKSMSNPKVRDLQLDIPAVSAESLLEDNLVASGWTPENGCWVRYAKDKIVFSLEDMDVEVEDRTMQIKATFAMPLPWEIAGADVARIPIKVRTSIFYVD